MRMKVYWFKQDYQEFREQTRRSENNANEFFTDQVKIPFGIINYFRWVRYNKSVETFLGKYAV